MHFTVPFFFGHRVCSFRRKHAAPSGWGFLRNYKRLHRRRIEQAIHQAGLEAHLRITDKAFAETGQELPEKIAVYAQSQEAAALFFQFYARVKSENQQGTARRLGSNWRTAH